MPTSFHSLRNDPPPHRDREGARGPFHICSFLCSLFFFALIQLDYFSRLYFVLFYRLGFALRYPSFTWRLAGMMGGTLV
jgi:hypothetical protein